MEKKQEHEEKKADDIEEDKKKGLEGLPVEDTPYVKYKDLEDYKRQGYGTQGHVQPKPGPGAANSTDAPTLSAANLSSKHDHFAATYTIDRQGVP